MTSTPRSYRDVAELVAGASEREVLAHAPGKSGARLERVVIGGQPYVLKHLDLADDWTMRASGCLPGAPLVLWQRGILTRLPDCFNQPIVGAAPEPGTGAGPSGGCALLMRDVSGWLVPATDEPISAGQHGRFLAHMAALHAAFWGCGREFDVVPVMHRYLELSPWTAEAEAATGRAGARSGLGRCPDDGLVEAARQLGQDAPLPQHQRCPGQAAGGPHGPVVGQVEVLEHVGLPVDDNPLQPGPGLARGVCQHLPH